jgi:CO dehydrogenase maturation factor
MQIICKNINFLLLSKLHMILGFLGKGGSGKSSVSTQMALYLSSKDKAVLAIDADHNMDLSYNLANGEMPILDYLSHSLLSLQDALQLPSNKKYSDAFFQESLIRFSLSPLSPEIEQYSTILPSGIRLMAAGPQTDTVLYGKTCSHSLTTPLKLLLPLLSLNGGEMVVVDEKAGADGVTTGIVTGIDVGVIVCEPALHSIKTAKQIAELMDFYQTPYVFVGNKVSNSEDKDFIEKELGVTPTTYLMQSSSVKRNPSELVSEWQDELAEIVKVARGLNKGDRLERTKAKFSRNHEFASH